MLSIWSSPKLCRLVINIVVTFLVFHLWKWYSYFHCFWMEFFIIVWNFVTSYTVGFVGSIRTLIILVFNYCQTTNLGLFQIERVYRREFQMRLNWSEVYRYDKGKKKKKKDWGQKEKLLVNEQFLLFPHCFFFPFNAFHKSIFFELDNYHKKSQTVTCASNFSL